MQEILRYSSLKLGDVKMPDWKKVNWLIVAGIATIAYTLAFVGWIGFDRILIYPTNNSLNEVGDFIAGVFSPLAFIWLVAAVLTQRQELTETRDQFVENQKVVDAQLKTINEQSDLLQQQHTLAEETARKTYRLSLFQERYKLYSDFISLGERHKSTHFGKAYSEMVELSARARFVFGDEIQAWFESIEHAIFCLNEERRQSITEGYDNGGHFISVFKSEADERRCSDLEHSITEQFTNIVALAERFEKSMTISDE